MMGLITGILIFIGVCIFFILLMFPMFIGILDEAGLLRRFQNPAPNTDALAVWEQTKVSMERRLQQLISSGDLEGSAKIMEMLERHKITMPAIPFWKKLK